MVRFASAAAAIFLLGACSEPFIVFAGGSLDGDVADPPSEWSILAEIETVQLETQPDDPYSVNVWAAAVASDVYIATGENGTTWSEHFDVNRDVRLRIDGQIFDLEAVRVDDPAELQRVSAAYVGKYGLERDDNWVTTGQVFRLDRR
jgi:hypothetical protein